MTGRPEERDSRLLYVPGLDGLRALAVIAVLLYHADLAWIPGGFLGVEVFFVISGFLIASLLLAEWQRQGRIDLRTFWLRRARRLFPALFLVIVASLAFAVAFLPAEVAELRGDALAAIGYATNWYLVFNHQSYFVAVGRPSLLQHLWSLAVEGQFYLLWPLLFIAGMRLWRRRYMLLAVLAGAVASSVLMAALYQPDVDPSRLYYGTDTRAAGLLLGAALAFVWTSERLRSRAIRVNALLLDVIGLGALAALVGFYLRVDEFQPFLYQGGLALVALTTAVLIALAVHPRARLVPRLLGQRLLRWVGLRSYGIYLWHWPVFMVTRPQLDVPLDGLPLLALRLVATGVLAELSYRYVETPIRTGALGRARQALREARGDLRWRLGVRWAGAVGAIAAFSITLGVSLASAQPSTPPAYLSVEAIHIAASDTTFTSDTMMASPGLSVTLSADPELAASLEALAIQAPMPAGEPPPAPRPEAESVLESTPPDGLSLSSFALLEASLQKPRRSPQARPAPALAQTRGITSVVRVTAIGDSVMLGAAIELKRAIPDADIDAAVGRQVSTAIDILRARRAAGQLGSIVIVHIGNNGTFSAKQFDEMMQVLAGAQVIFLDIKVPRHWESSNNTVLAEGVKRYPNAVLVDWRAASTGHPELFWSDGFHLRPEGARVYVDLIAARVNGPRARSGSGMELESGQ